MKLDLLLERIWLERLRGSVKATVGTAGVSAAVPFISAIMPSQCACPAGATDVILTVIKRS
jgi:hypothetical protein